MQILFLVLLTGSSVLFIWNAVESLPAHLILPIPILLGLPYVFTYLTVCHKAHFITAANHQSRLHDWPYDHILFHPGVVCSTCNQIKPARSKHCSLCGHCVAKCDHHCPWVSNCLGRGNYRYFLGLLLSLGLLQLYGAYLSYFILSPYVIIDPSASFLSADYWNQLGNGVVVAVNEGGLSIAGVGLLAAATACLPLALLAYHLYLIWAGMTTNESQKWADWRDDMADGFVFRASRQALQTHNSLRKYGDRQSGNGHLMATNGHSASGNPALDSVGEPHVPWPKQSDVVLVRTNDGKPPTGQDALWTRVWHLSEVDNIYDLGAFENLKEVLKGH